jgi:proline iminopeptidase
MFVDVGCQRLFVEVIGAKLAIHDCEVRERPTVVLAHGGPAWDHLTLRVDFEPLEDVAQLVFYDHRGLGRSDVSDPGSWTLKQWAADLHELLEVLGIYRPIVLGQSFGGMVAQRFATDFPESYSGLILSSTAARFDLDEVVSTFRRLGGEELATLAHSFYTSSNAEHRDRFLQEGFPFYTIQKAEIGAHSPFKPDVLDHFFSDSGDARTFDYRSDLVRVSAPVLILGGDSDPVISANAVRELADSFSPGVSELHIFETCGHGPVRDQPSSALAILRDFIARVSSSEDRRTRHETPIGARHRG